MLKYKLCKNKGERYSSSPEECEKEIEEYYQCHKKVFSYQGESRTDMFETI